jgi:two-component system CheB/CheR fusion protein
MFRQADSSNSRRHGGLGIGLALVQQLVQLHGGTIAAHSEGPNKGSRFTVRLPLLRETGPLSSSGLASAAVNKLSIPPRTSFLIVDDSEDTIRMLEQILKMGGANVNAATNGRDALRLASEHEYDIILSDISMPEMDGFEFLQRLRTIEGRQHVPVVAITGFGRSDDIERARAAGFYSHLTKPLNLDALGEVLAQLAHDQRGRGIDGHDHTPDTDFDATAGPVC